MGELVHKDTPTGLLTELLDWLLKDGAKINTDLYPKVPYQRFNQGGVTSVYRLLGDLVDDVSPTAFAIKWYYQAERPECVIRSWAEGKQDVSGIVDDELRHYIDRDEVLKNEYSSTLYKEGCPPHYRYIAMHSALSSVAMILPIVLKMSNEGRDQCRKFQSFVAYGRTASFMHLAEDNTEGMNVGEKCAEILLPKYLSRYGANEDEVKAMCKENSNDWVRVLSV